MEFCSLFDSRQNDIRFLLEILDFFIYILYSDLEINFNYLNMINIFPILISSAIKEITFLIAEKKI